MDSKLSDSQTPRSPLAGSNARLLGLCLIAAGSALASPRAHGAARPPAAPLARSLPLQQAAPLAAPDWTATARRVYQSFAEDRILAVSAGITFYGLLAIFPAIAAFLAVYGLFADAATVQSDLSSLAGIVPDGALDIIGDQVKRIAGKGGPTLGLAFALSFATSLWSANAGMKALIEGLNIAYGKPESRGFIALNLTSLGFTLGAILALALAMSLVVVAPAVLGFLGLGGAGRALIAFGRWPALLAIVIFGLAILYRYAPTPAGRRWRWVSPGSALAAALWLAASIGFSWYASHFGSYNETYGSLGAAVGFMTWIWISMIVILLGAEVNGELEALERKAGWQPEGTGAARPR